MRQKTRIFIYILIAVAVVIMGTLAILTNHQADKPASAQEHIDFGRIYFTELSYEKAVLEFTEAIEIEPLNPDAYLGLAEAYVGMGDTTKAVEVLEEGYDKTGDERLRDMLDELQTQETEETSVVTITETSITTTEEITTVSTAAMVIVPNLSGLTEEEAAAACKAAGLKYSVSYDYSDEVEKGVVIKQNIPVNTSVAEGISVPLILSKGAEVTPTVETIIETTVSAIVVTTISTNTQTEATTETEPVEEFITIKGRKYSTSLTKLDLSRKDLSDDDIKPLNKMKNLTYLTLYSNKISDISPIAELTKLTELNLNANEIEDISALSNLTNLTKLNLGVNNVIDIRALSNLTNLTDLDIWSNRISDLSPISGLTNLTTLSITQNKIKDISCLAELKNLKYLHLGSNKISNIDVLMDLTNLKALTGLDSIDITADDVHKIRRALPNCSTDGDWKIVFNNLN